MQSASQKETGRVEAFSDGVFAIAMTLLVLNIHVPRADEVSATHTLARVLIEQWPTYATYIISFVTVLIMWTNHHKLLEHVHRTDHWFLMINGLLLMGVTVVPFPTALVATFIRSPHAGTAAAVYSGSFVAVAVLYNVLWRYAAHRNRLLRPDRDDRFVTAINRQYLAGPVVYSIAFVLAFLSPAASVAVNAGLALFFALPAAQRRRNG